MTASERGRTALLFDLAVCAGQQSHLTALLGPAHVRLLANTIAACLEHRRRMERTRLQSADDEMDDVMGALWPQLHVTSNNMQH